MSQKHAIVFSGGGALGAYEVGVMKALTSSQSFNAGHDTFDPQIFTGTSVGAYNAAFLAAQSDVSHQEAVARLEKVWLEVIADQGDGFGNGVFRYRANPFEFLNPIVVARYPLRTLTRFLDDAFALSFQAFQRLIWFFREVDESIPDRIASLFDLSALMSMDPLEETLKETIDYERLSRFGKPLWIAATNWTSGSLDLAQKHEMTRTWGPRLIKGSVSIPGVFPPEGIGDDFLVDGGVLMNTPLVPAIQLGADTIHVITLFPKEPYNSDRTLASTLGAMNRAQQFSWDFIVNVAFRNVAIADRILADLKDLAEKNRRTVIDREAREIFEGMLETIQEEVIEALDLPEDRLPEVHRYQPSQEIEDGPLAMLLFERDRIETMIEQGFMDTCRHDCEENGCIVASNRELYTFGEEQLLRLREYASEPPNGRPRQALGDHHE